MRWICGEALYKIDGATLDDLREARHMRETRCPTARTHAYKTLLRFPVEGLRANIARLALGVVRAFLDRDRDGLCVLLIRMVLLGTTCFFYFLTNFVVAAFFPVLHLAFGPTVACAAAAAFLSQG